MKEESSMHIHPYGKKELIEAYCGNYLTERGARRWFKNELEKCPGLMDTLVRLGYSPRQRAPK